MRFKWIIRKIIKTLMKRCLYYWWWWTSPPLGISQWYSIYWFIFPSKYLWTILSQRCVQARESYRSFQMYTFSNSIWCWKKVIVLSSLYVCLNVRHNKFGYQVIHSACWEICSNLSNSKSFWRINIDFWHSKIEISSFIVLFTLNQLF